MAQTVQISFSCPKINRLEIDAAVTMYNPQNGKCFGSFSEALSQFAGKDLLLKARNTFNSGGSYGSCVKLSSRSLKENGINNVLYCSVPQADLVSMMDENCYRLAYLNALARATEEKCCSIAIPLVTAMRKTENLYKIASLVLLQSICIFLSKYPRTSIKQIDIVTTDKLAVKFLRGMGHIFDVPIPVKYFKSLLRYIQRRPERRRLELVLFGCNVRFFTDIKNCKTDALQLKLTKEMVHLKAHAESAFDPPSHYETAQIRRRAELLTRLKHIIAFMKNRRMKKVVKWNGPVEREQFTSKVFKIERKESSEKKGLRQIIKLRGGKGKKRNSGRDTSKDTPGKRRSDVEKEAATDDSSNNAATTNGDVTKVLRSIQDILQSMMKKRAGQTSKARKSKEAEQKNKEAATAEEDDIEIIEIPSTPSSCERDTVPQTPPSTQVADKSPSATSTPRRPQVDLHAGRNAKDLCSDRTSSTIEVIDILSTPSSGEEETVPRTPPSPSIARKSPTSTPRTPFLDPKTGRHKRALYADRIGTQRLKMKSLRNYRTSRNKSSFEFDERRIEDVQYRLEAMNVLRRFISEKIASVRHHIRDQLQFDVAGPKNMTSMERKKRQLYRINIHVYTGEDDGYVYEPMSEIFDEIWYDFMGFFNPSACHHAKKSRKVVNSNEPELAANDIVSNDLEMEEQPVTEMEQMDVEEQPEAEVQQEDVEEQSEDEQMELSDEEVEIAMDCTQKSENSEQADRVASVLRNELNLSYDSVFNLPPTDDDSEEDSDSVAARARRAARQSPPPHSPVRLPDIGIVADVIEERFGEQIFEEMQQDDGYAINLIGQYTRARRCDEHCPVVNIEEAAAIHDALMNNLRLLDGTAEEFRLKNLMYAWDDQVQSVDRWITDRQQCSQGLRSIKKRYAELDTLVTILAVCDNLIALEDNAGMQEFLSLETLPVGLRSEFREKFESRKNEDHHRQEYVEERFKRQLDGFARAQEDQETHLCDVCGKYTIPKYITSKPKSRYVDWLTDEVKERDTDVISICEICRKCNVLPDGALINNFIARPVPEVIASLNVLERMLIARYRPNMKIFFLRSVANKQTKMKATRGCLVVFPTEIEATANHVLDTLPSDSNLHIQVRTLWEKTYIVSMPKIIAALNWLKANNRLYADVTINENFRFNVGENLVFERSDANEDDAERMINRRNTEDGDDGHLLTQDVVEEQPLQRVHEKRSTEEAVDQYLLQQHRYAPVNLENPDIDVGSFPDLHPYGDDGYKGRRVRPIRCAKYFRNRVLCDNIRWATSANWMTFMYGLKQQTNLTSVQGIQARVRPETKSKEFDLTDEQVQKCLQASYSKTRGFPQYWQSVKYCLRSHVAVFGAPTWFLTLNPNVKGWTDLHEEYAQKLKREVNEDNIDEIIAFYPVVFSRYWKKRVAEFFRNVLLDKEGPLGEVIHFFHRTEYQHRGTQHVHCVLWTKDRPKPNSSPEFVQDFIDRHVTARLPNKEEEPELFALVNNPQKHFDKHTRTCQRKVRMGRRVLTTRCRFGFPRPYLRRTTVWDHEKKIRIPGIANRPYSLARREEERMVNDYSAAVLLGWGANIDLQYIPSNVKDVVNYITAYTTKGEKAKRLASDKLKQYALEGTTRSKILFKLAMDICDQREVGLLEITDDALGHKNFEFDTAHIFIPIDSKNERLRILKPKKNLKDEEVVYETNWLDNYYRNRQKRFEGFSLYNMMTNFEIVTASSSARTRRNRKITDEEREERDAQKKSSKKKNSRKAEDGFSDSDDSEEDEEDEVDILKRVNIGNDRFNIYEEMSPFFFHPDIAQGERFTIQTERAKMIRKIKQKIGRFYLPRLVWNEIESVENYYSRLSRLFIPWRNEENFLEEFGVSTYAEVWKNFMSRLKEEARGAWDDITLVLEGYTSLLNEEKELEDRMKEIQKMKEALQIDEEVEEQMEIQSRIVDPDVHKEHENNLNTGQQDIYAAILKRIEEQAEIDEKNKTIEVENADLVRTGNSRQPLLRRPDSIQMFVSGTAGTGKSFLINTLADALTLRYVPADATGLRPACVLAAPTGIAALNIHGNTLHALLGIEVVQADHRGEEEFEQLSPEKFDLLKMLFSNVRLIIIDEISMVSNVMLMKVNKRLRELSGRNEAFGGYNILMFGDLLQLPPVKAPEVFKKLNARLKFFRRNSSAVPSNNRRLFINAS